MTSELAHSAGRAAATAAGHASAEAAEAAEAAGAAALLARDRAARIQAQTVFDRPLVLEAGAGTGKTTTLIARLLAWCLGEGWEQAARNLAAPPAAPTCTATAGAAAALGPDAPAPEARTDGQPVGERATPASGGLGSGSLGAQPDTSRAAAVPEGAAGAGEAIAARVLRRVVALTFTEAAAAEMAARAARELLGLASGGTPPDWLAAARLPQGGELGRRARALLATLDHLPVETIHAYCLRLLASWPLEAGVHPRLTVDADGGLLEQVISETVEAALRPGYGVPGDPHLLALAALGCGPREVAEALTALIAAGLPAAALAADPFGGDGWMRLRGRVTAACARLHGLLASPLSGCKLKNATAIRDAMARLVEPAAGAGVDADADADAGSGVEARGAEARGMEGRVGEAIGVEARSGAASGAVAGGGEASGGQESGKEPSGGEAAAAAILRARQVAEALLPANLRARLKDWGRGRLKGAEEQLRLAPIRDDLAVAATAVARLIDHLTALDPERLRRGRLALAPLLATVEGELTRRGVATFDALLSGARRLLAQHPQVRARLRRGIDQLLVDEFQDTDATQCEVLRWIALDGPAQERPGLFLVGDPKQSIYGWRSADLRAYDGFVEQVRQAGGEVLPLVENFRSVPAILDEVALVMTPVMQARRGVQPAFAPLLPCERRGGDAGFTLAGRAPIEHWVSWLPDTAATGRAPATAADDLLEVAPPPPSQAPAASAAAELEAAAIAADLRELHELHGVRWQDAALLLRGTGDLDVYLDALRRASIPFAVGRDKQYYRRREVIDTAALVRAVLDPGDHLALLTLLRSPLVGVPDAALLPLWRHQLPRLLTELHEPAAAELAAVRQAVEAAARQIPPGVPGLERVAGWELCLLAVVEQLAVLRRSAAEEPADLFVERLRRLLLLDATAAARHLGSYRLANLDRFFRQLLLEIEQGSGDVTAVLRALRTSVAAGREAEEGRPPEGAGDAVQVLTIHGAKGLDFPHVYLPQLHRLAGGDRAPATAAGRLDEPQAAGGARYEYRLFGAATPGFDCVEERRLEVEAAERVRTLYVAMTRAKDRLVLAGAWPPLPGPPLLDQARTHLDLLAHRPGCPDLRQLWRDGARTRSDGEAGAVAPVLWKFPALARGAPPAAGEAPPAAGLAQPEDVAAQAALLAAWRQAAAAHMTRPFGSAASEEAHAQLREQLAAAWDATPGEGGQAGAEKPAGVPIPADASQRSVPQPEAAAGGAAESAGREAAMAAGAAFHRALELWDLAAEPRRELERQRGLLPAYLAAVAAGEPARRALPRCAALLDRFAAGGLAERLRRIAGQVLAREMPVLLPPPAPRRLPAGGEEGFAGFAAEDPAGSVAAGPVGFVAGAVDLLYRDPGSGELVIADYKTDEVAGAELARRAAAYASQGSVYVRAVQSALDLAVPPRFELWFVHAGEVVTPPPSAAAAPEPGRPPAAAAGPPPLPLR